MEVLKNLVNEFSRYARMPVTTPALNDLNEVIADSVLLFQDAHKEIVFEFKNSCKDYQSLNSVPSKLIGVLINLLDNAVAAINKRRGRIEIPGKL